MGIDRSQMRFRSYLFTVRVWEEEIEPGKAEVRGKVQLLTTGETRHFREWTRLVPLLLTMLSELDVEQGAKE